MTTYTIHFATAFTRFPAGRFKIHGPYTGEGFRDDILIPALEAHPHVTVDFDEVMGLGSGFLEETFGGLIRKGYTVADLRTRLELVDIPCPADVDRAWGFMEDAETPVVRQTLKEMRRKKR